jgi:hypothetical protein
MTLIAINRPSALDEEPVCAGRAGWWKTRSFAALCPTPEAPQEMPTWRPRSSLYAGVGLREDWGGSSLGWQIHWIRDHSCTELLHSIDESAPANLHPRKPRSASGISQESPLADLNYSILGSRSIKGDLLYNSSNDKDKLTEILNSFRLDQGKWIPTISGMLLLFLEL